MRRNWTLINIGLFLIIVSLVWRSYRQDILAFDTNAPQVYVEEATSNPPAVSISIDKVNINLPVEEAAITDGTWEISETGASHWDNSANPGERGNIVIYAHNKTNLFGPIRWLSAGDTLEVTNLEGEVFKYAIESTKNTKPDDLSAILPTEEEVLTLYTCNGFLDSERFIITAKPLN